VSQDSKKTTLIKDVFSKPSRKIIPAIATQADFNGDGRFVLLYDDAHVSTYDLEKKALYMMPPEMSKVTGISWFDNYHLIFSRNGESVLSEFDGNYAHVLATGSSMDAFGAADTKSVLFVAPKTDGTSSIRSVRIRQ
jgi:hypothetical protein